MFVPALVCKSKAVKSSRTRAVNRCNGEAGAVVAGPNAVSERSDVGSVNAVADRIADIERQKDSHEGIQYWVHTCRAAWRLFAVVPHECECLRARTVTDRHLQA